MTSNKQSTGPAAVPAIPRLPNVPAPFRPGLPLRRSSRLAQCSWADIARGGPAPAAAAPPPAVVVAPAQAPAPAPVAAPGPDRIVILGSARRHYSDGWGARYGIRNDSQLRTEVWSLWPDNPYVGQRIDGALTQGCNLKFRMERRADRGWNAVVYHCGPSLFS